MKKTIFEEIGFWRMRCHVHLDIFILWQLDITILEYLGNWTLKPSSTFALRYWVLKSLNIGFRGYLTLWYWHISILEQSESCYWGIEAYWLLHIDTLDICMIDSLRYSVNFVSWHSNKLVLGHFWGMYSWSGGDLQCLDIAPPGCYNSYE